MAKASNKALSQAYIFQTGRPPSQSYPVHISSRENRNNCWSRNMPAFKEDGCRRSALRNAGHVRFPDLVCLNVCPEVSFHCSCASRGIFWPLKQTFAFLFSGEEHLGMLARLRRPLSRHNCCKLFRVLAHLFHFFLAHKVCETNPLEFFSREKCHI